MYLKRNSNWTEIALCPELLISGQTKRLKMRRITAVLVSVTAWRWGMGVGVVSVSSVSDIAECHKIVYLDCGIQSKIYQPGASLQRFEMQGH